MNDLNHQNRTQNIWTVLGNPNIWTVEKLYHFLFFVHEECALFGSELILHSAFSKITF